VTLEYATLPSNQACKDITSWSSVPLGSIAGATQKGIEGDATANIVAPACLRLHFVLSGARVMLGGGTAALYFTDGPMHFDASNSGGTFTNNAYFIGNIGWPTISPGVAVTAAAGVVGVPTPAGSGNTFHFKFAQSTTGLAAGQTCNDLTYTLSGDAATISGATQRSASFTGFPISVPANGCLQIRVTCTGGTCAAQNDLYAGLDLTTASQAASYSDAGSGAFDANHRFGPCTWAISDANCALKFDQQYWLAPPTGLSALAGAFNFDSGVGGTGHFDVGVRYSATAPTSTEACQDLTNYTETGALCSLTNGSKGCSFPLTPISIPPNACFALNVTASGGNPTNTSSFNWQAIGSVPEPRSSTAAAVALAALAALRALPSCCASPPRPGR